jgi:threonine aldolase
MVQAPIGYASAATFTAKLKEEGIIVSAFGQRVIRLTTHQDVSIDLLPKIIEVFKKVQEA